MENFILYDEINKFDDAIVYKGRRKGKINFVAILCLDKMNRAPVTNHVRISHEIKHDNIVRFLEWYETSNHLWLVQELCTGGTLEILLSQDGCLPESCISDFSQDIIRGLHHIHNLGVIFWDLNPSKVFIDGSGNLKLSNFEFSRQFGEDLMSLLLQFDDNYDQSKKSLGTFRYQSPEIINNRSGISFMTDLWSLGIVIYEMLTSETLFGKVTLDGYLKALRKFSDDALYSMILSACKYDTACSKALLSLLKGLLTVDCKKRIAWSKIIQHDFFRGSIDDLDELDL